MKKEKILKELTYLYQWDLELCQQELKKGNRVQEEFHRGAYLTLESIIDSIGRGDYD